MALFRCGESGGGETKHYTYASGTGSDVTIQHPTPIQSVVMIEKYGSATTASYWFKDDPTHAYQYWVNGSISTITLPNTSDGNTIRDVIGNTVKLNFGSTATNIEVLIS